MQMQSWEHLVQKRTGFALVSRSEDKSLKWILHPNLATADRPLPFTQFNQFACRCFNCRGYTALDM
jgi:hypothetical protein